MPSSPPIIPILLLSILAILAIDFLFLQLERNGYSEFLTELRDDPSPRFLPNSERLLVRQYTGVPSIDRIWATLSVVWANVLDGSRPEFTLLAFNFAGQMVPFLMVVIVESWRTVESSGLVFRYAAIS